MGQPACQMWDKRSITSFIIFIVNYLVYNLYLYEMFWGTWNIVYTKGLFYLATAIVMLYFIIDEMRNYYFLMQYHIKIAYFLSLILTFILFYLILAYKLKEYPVTTLLVYNSIIIFILISILCNGIKYKLFKHP